LIPVVEACREAPPNPLKKLLKTKRPLDFSKMDILKMSKNGFYKIIFFHVTEKIFSKNPNV
jgi:hypothetical protein